MNWINSRKVGSAVLIAWLSGCANQNTLLPPTEREMIDIYREAMNEVDAPPAPVFDPQVICGSLELSESIKACQRKLAAHAKRVYQVIDTEESPQPMTYAPYTRTALTELKQLFPRHDNPDMVIYVYPHLATRTRAPIPGYTTVIPLYERIEYRLPGEAGLNTPEKLAETDTQGSAP